MSESMQKEIDALVAELSPKPGSLGILTTHEMVSHLRMAATRGALIGWVAAEKLTTNRFKEEYENMAHHCKQLELEIMELKR
jgi:hypothetical protein